MLQEVKTYCQITWNKDDADITKMIERGKKYLERLTGTTLNFLEEDLPKQLLLDYCRYERNNSLEFFQRNFAEDINLLQIEEAIKKMKEGTPVV